MSPKNLRVVFAIEKPKKVEPGVFHIAETDMPRPADGEVLLKTLYLSCDPYMILQITGWGRTSAPTEVGRPMHGRAVRPRVRLVAHVVAGESLERRSGSAGRRDERAESSTRPLHHRHDRPALRRKRVEGVRN